MKNKDTVQISEYLQYVTRVCEYCKRDCPQLVETYVDKPYKIVRCTLCDDTGEVKV